MKIKKLYNNHIKTKLANQIVLVVAVTCILQMTAALGMYLFSYRERKEEVIENNERILQQANNNYLSMLLNELSNATTEIFIDEVFWGNGAYAAGAEDNRIYSILAGKYHSLGSIDSIYLFSSREDKLYIMDQVAFTGIPVQSAGKNNFLPEGSDPRASSWYQEAEQKNGDLAVTRNKELRKGTKDIISFSRYLNYPLKTQDSYFAVSVNMDEKRFSALKDQLCEEDEFLMVLDAGNHFVYGNAGEEMERVVSRMAGDFAGPGSEWRSAGVGNQKYIVIGNRSEADGWTMFKIIPKKKITERAASQLLGSSLLILAVFLLGGAGLYYVINKSTRPVEKLARVMRHYHQGQIKKEPELAKRPDEVGVLYQSFEKMNDRIDRLIASEYQSQIQEKQARLETLQAQLNPHFLYNTLQTVSGLAIEKGIPEIEQIVQSLSSILRYSLSKNKSIVKVSEELMHLRDYMKIQEFRYGERIALEVRLSPEIMEYPVPVFALQLAVENAIKHGLEKKVGTEKIEIYDTAEESMREICIRDNGAGISPERLEEIQRMLREPAKAGNRGADQKGLVNLNERVRQQFGMEYGADIQNNTGEGVTVTIRLPSVREEGESC